MHSGILNSINILSPFAENFNLLRFVAPLLGENAILPAFTLILPVFFLVAEGGADHTTKLFASLTTRALPGTDDFPEDRAFVLLSRQSVFQLSRSTFSALSENCLFPDKFSSSRFKGSPFPLFGDLLWLARILPFLSVFTPLLSVFGPFSLSRKLFLSP